MSYLSPKQLAQVEVSAWAAKQGSLLELVFSMPPVLLPDNTPQEIVSAWTRIYNGARDDFKMIERWLVSKPPDCER
jgi:hypothetical protein